MAKIVETHRVTLTTMLQVKVGVVNLPSLWLLVPHAMPHGGARSTISVIAAAIGAVAIAATAVLVFFTPGVLVKIVFVLAVGVLRAGALVALALAERRLVPAPPLLLRALLRRIPFPGFKLVIYFK